jgi:DNA-binding MarR family transcriptional regulator
LSLNGEDAILSYLRKKSPATIKQISRALILSKTRVVRVLERLISLDTVERIDNEGVEKFRLK